MYLLSKRVGAIKTCTKIGVTHGGRFKLEDPNGEQVGGDLNMSDVAGDTLLVSEGGLEFLITDGGTNFAVADFITLVVTDLGAKWTPWVEDGEPLRMDFDTADDQLFLVSTEGIHLMEEVE